MAEFRRHRAPRGSGDLLHDEILSAATELLLETGRVKAVSIRSVARRVGVTPPSIYLHFEDKDALLDAVCARCLAKLDWEMELVRTSQPSNLAVLRAQGLAYIRFATECPELYRIATMGAWRAGNCVDATLAGSVFEHMRVTVQALINDGTYPPGDPESLALEMWSAAHGVASLLIAKPYLPFGDVEAFADRVLGAVCRGHMVAGPADADATSPQTVDWLPAVNLVDTSSEGKLA